MNAPPADTRVCPALLRIPPAPPGPPLFATHTARREAEARAARRADRRAAAGLAVFFAAALAAAYAAALATAGPIRPHVAATLEAPR
jgi:hypothetical protein